MSLTHYTPPSGPGFLLPLCNPAHLLRETSREHVSIERERVTCPACLALIAPADPSISATPAR